ncbi:universal stress protein [Streptomyces sp. NEAU-W12]|uniref:universal stress protein n=1 Tax=Streptomyces sp. NEAU-W12 TaxID=2994668 RepID=UPI00224B8E6C|nr:universal stress protein [Streptomyces sp. NEAU-W12]MCX2928060.1 universal stress protein [Streptomyces sp. NEAU-W12]
MSRPVTVGVDGSPGAVAATGWAAREAVLRGVDLRIVYADQWPGPATAQHGRPAARSRWAEDLLAEAAGAVRLEYPSLEIETRHRSGQPAEVLADEASEAGLLVLGSRGLGGVRGFLLGSVGMATISVTERPVVLVRAPGRSDAGDGDVPAGPARDVVVGVDLDQFFAPLLDFAFQEAVLRGDRVLVLYGWSIMPVVRDALALVAAEREMGPDIVRRLREALRPWRRKYPAAEVAERSPFGGPARLLLHAADNADLVAVGRRVRRGSLGAHIGSVTHALIHHCPVPVAVIAHG